MAAYPIYVTYTPETTGCHHICYRLLSGPGPIGPDPTFCCFDDIVISAPQVGVPRTAPVIDAGVTACATGGPITVPGSNGPGEYIYEGYVQPCCDPGDGFKTNWSATVSYIVV